MLLSVVGALVIIGTACVMFARAAQVIRKLNTRRHLVGFMLLIALSLLAGVKWGIFSHVRLTERMAIQGFPIPLVVFVREHDEWADFVRSEPVGYACMVADSVFPLAISMACVAIYGRFQGRRGRASGVSSIDNEMSR